MGNALVTRVLSGAGYQVHSFQQGEKALHWLEQDHRACIVLVSLDIADISGHEFVWQARLIGSETRPLYVVAMDSPKHEAVAEALDSGADDFVSKPLVMVDLQARLRAAQRTLTLQSRLIKMAMRDPLTNALNRRAFFTVAEKCCQQQGRAAALITFDIDFFKHINDQFGHDVGDMVLAQVARMSSSLAGYPARLGGEEFAVLLPDASLETAEAIAEDLRLRICGEQIASPKGMVTFTASFGVTRWHGAGDTISAFLKRADVALYRSKASGRNRISLQSQNEASEASDFDIAGIPAPLATKKVKAA